MRIRKIAAMFAAACNWEAAEHLARGRARVAADVAGRGLRALEAWFDDPQVPCRFPAWLWAYLHLHLGEAHLRLVEAGDPRGKPARAEWALTRAAARRPGWDRPWVGRVRLAWVCGDAARAAALLGQMRASEHAGLRRAARRLAAGCAGACRRGQ